MKQENGCIWVSNKKVYAFIFARGGSKGLPKKNIRKLNGKPLISYSIEVAKSARSISKIFVSTDDENIKIVAKKLGVEIIDRPKYLAEDGASEIDCWKHAVKHLEDKGESFDVFISLPATSPLRSNVDVNECISALDETVDTVITVTPSARSPYFNMVKRDHDGYCSIIIPEDKYIRRQDVPASYDITTVAYVSRPCHVLRLNNLFDGLVKGVVIPKQRAIDIDDIYDFNFAESIIAGKTTYE